MPREKTGGKQHWNGPFSLARQNQADLTVVDVLELSGDLQVIGRDKLDKFTSEIVGKRLARLDNIVQHVQSRVAIQTKVIQGTAFLEIIREVLRNNYDLVMKMSGGRRRLKNMLFGSTDMHLLRKCPCPVWIMKPVVPFNISVFWPPWTLSLKVVIDKKIH